jgi:hypothetical protein
MNLWDKLFGRARTEAYLTASARENAGERWRWVEDQVELGKPNNLKLAIIEADKIIDEVLKSLYPDEKELVQRLKLVQPKFSDRQVYDDLWYAHKVRNIVVHELNYDLPSHEARNVLEKYKRAIEVLGVL